MYNRKYYIEQISKWRDKPLIKIITGLRRSGKSTLIKLYMEELFKKGVSKQHVFYINKESLEFETIKTYNELYKEVRKRWKENKRKLYLFIDEVQEISEWEKAVVSVHSEGLADVYVTGSNARIFSKELATLLGGRYIQIPIFPLTFSEFLVFRGISQYSEDDFNEFIEYGGMPGIHHLHWERQIIYEYISAIYDTIILRDVVTRNNIRNAAFLEKVIRFIFDNIAQIFSAKKVVDFLKKEHRRTSIETVYNYIKFLEDAHVIYRVPRYDIKGKRLLEVREKYFLTDVGLRHAILGYRKQDINQLLENIVFIELKKRGYSVYIGQLPDAEIDFIIERENKKAYLQIAYLLASKNAIAREFGALAKINDNYPKYVLSLDKHFVQDSGGINHLNIIEFLLSAHPLL